jgi:hypothetical protein
LHVRHALLIHRGRQDLTQVPSGHGRGIDPEPVAVRAVREYVPLFRRHVRHQRRQRVGQQPHLLRARLQRFLGAAALGDVHAVHEDATDRALGVAHGLKDEIDDAVLGRLAGASLKRDGATGTDERLAARVDVVEQFVKTLAFDVRQRGAHRFADDVTPTDQLRVAVVDHLEDMLGSAQQRDERRRLLER